MIKKKIEERPLTVKEVAAMGGNARAKGLSKKRRNEIAENAAKARCGEKEEGKPK